MIVIGGAMKSYVFKVIIEEDPFEDGIIAYHAYIPALKDCFSWGYTYEEALENIRSMAQLVIEDMIEHNEPVPEGPADLVQVYEEPQVAVTVEHGN